MWKKIPLFVFVLAVGGCSFAGSFAAGAGDAAFDFSTWKPYALGISALTSAVGLALSLGQWLFGAKPLTLGAFVERMDASEAKAAKERVELDWAVREQAAEVRGEVRQDGARTRDEIVALSSKVEAIASAFEQSQTTEVSDVETRDIRSTIREILESDRQIDVTEALAAKNFDLAASRLLAHSRQSAAGATDLAEDAAKSARKAGYLYLGRDTLKAIGAFEAARDAKPNDFRTRAELGRLYLRAGRTGEAEIEARACRGCATTDRERAIALNELGNVLVRQGRTDEALTTYEEGLEVARDLLASDPGSAEAKRDVSVSLDRIGDVLVRQGRTDVALTAYEEGLEVAHDLLASDPNSAEAKRDVSVCQNKVGDMLVRQGRTAEALAAYEEGLEVRRALLASDPGSAVAKRDVSVSLTKVGDVLVRQGRTDEALTAYEECLGVARDLLATDPGSALAKRDVSVSLERLGDVLVRQGRTAEARGAYEEGLEARRDLLASDPGSAEAKRDIVTSLAKLGDLSGEAGRDYWAEAHTLVKELHDAGRLNPADAWMLADTAKKAGLETSD